MAIILIAVVYFGLKLLTEWLEDAQMRNWAQNKGLDSYPSKMSKTGMKSTGSNKPMYYQYRVKNGKMTTTKKEIH